MSTNEERISLRVMVQAGDDTAVLEMPGPAAAENGLQAFGDWVAGKRRDTGSPPSAGGSG